MLVIDSIQRFEWNLKQKVRKTQNTCKFFSFIHSFWFKQMFNVFTFRWSWSSEFPKENSFSSLSLSLSLSLFVMHVSFGMKNLDSFVFCFHSMEKMNEFSIPYDDDDDVQTDCSFQMRISMNTQNRKIFSILSHTHRENHLCVVGL